MNPEESNSKTRNSVIGLLGCIAIISLFLFAYEEHGNTSMRYGLLAMCLVCMVLIVVCSEGANVKAKVVVPNKMEIEGSIQPRELGRPERKTVAIAPTIREKEDVATKDEKVKSVVDGFYKILESGEKTDYEAALRFLQENPDEVKKSWKLTSNFSRSLLMLGQYSQAQGAAEALLNKFAPVPEAVASAHELLSLCVDSLTPKEPGELRKEMLEQQMRHVELGLSASPKRLSLLLNGFEIASELKQMDKARSFLTKAALVNAGAAKTGIEKSIDANTDLKDAIKGDAELCSVLDVIGLEL